MTVPGRPRLAVAADQSFALYAIRILLHPAPWSLVAAHAILVLLVAPLIIATFNTETASLGLGILAVVDWPAFWLCDRAIDIWGPISPWRIVERAIFAGSLQWYLVGFLPLLLLRQNGRKNRT